jgi:hypothetical protein
MATLLLPEKKRPELADGLDSIRVGIGMLTWHCSPVEVERLVKLEFKRFRPS